MNTKIKAKKRILFFAVLLTFSVGLATGTLGFKPERLSLKHFKKALKKDSSEKGNAELAKEVLKRGVTFEYTSKRENSLREWGANQRLITAIFQSIADEKAEAELYRQFMKTHKAAERDTRKSALDKGRLYLRRFELYERFADNVDRLKKEIRYLECEFDPNLGC